jgi:hypothetical protein
MIQRFFLVLVVVAISFGCTRFKIDNPTNDFYEGDRMVKLKNPKLKEISGITASKSNSGYFWVHNDSGNEPQIFLIDQDLKIIMTCFLEGIINRDWEDITLGPGPKEGKTYIYIGDIGDNNADNSLKYIYRLEEPEFDGKTDNVWIKDFDRITFRLSGDKKDTETLLLDPRTRDLYVISKREEPVWLYKLSYPQSTSDTATATKLFSLPFTQIVGGDVSADGRKILLKNYEHIYYWKDEDGKQSIETLLPQKPYEVPYELEPQGEAIAWAKDNSGFFTLSEKNVGKETYLYFYKARDPGEN